MTQNARKVLEDCRFALSTFSDGIQGIEWRLKWVTIVALLRAVGHVLGKVDGKSDINPNISRTIEDKWDLLEKTKPNPVIFWEFIYKERNNILKSYDINAGQGVTIHVGTEPATATYNYPITSGYFKGREQRGIIKEAIEWWQSYLDSIDSIFSNAT
jgi:hypothetical protein